MDDDASGVSSITNSDAAGVATISAESSSSSSATHSTRSSSVTHSTRTRLRKLPIAAGRERKEEKVIGHADGGEIRIPLPSNPNGRHRAFTYSGLAQSVEDKVLPAEMMVCPMMEEWVDKTWPEDIELPGSLFRRKLIQTELIRATIKSDCRKGSIKQNAFAPHFGGISFGRHYSQALAKEYGFTGVDELKAKTLALARPFQGSLCLDSGILCFPTVERARNYFMLCWFLFKADQGKRLNLLASKAFRSANRFGETLCDRLRVVRFNQMEPCIIIVKEDCSPGIYYSCIEGDRALGHVFLGKLPNVEPEDNASKKRKRTNRK